MTATGQTWNAADYAQHSSAQLQWAEELLGKLRLRGDEAVLDIGSGDGKITARIADDVPRGRVLGIDRSPDMVRFAREVFPASAHPNLEFRQMDARAIQLPRRVDVAFSNATLHWVDDHPAMLAGVRGALTPGGRVLFQMGGRGCADGMLEVVEQVRRRPRWRAHFEGFVLPYHFHGPDDYQVWLAGAGLTPVRLELIPKDMQHEGARGLTGWLRTTWFPFTDRVPVESREAFLDEVVETYLAAHPLDADGKTHVDMVRLEVEAYAG